MTPERWAEIKKIASGLGRHGLLVGIIHELIAEVERLRSENERLQSGLDSAISLHMMDNQTIERLQADNERLTFVYLADTKISGALVRDVERLRAELAECILSTVEGRERQIEALGKARLSGLAFGGEEGG